MQKQNLQIQILSSSVMCLSLLSLFLSGSVTAGSDTAHFLDIKNAIKNAQPMSISIDIKQCEGNAHMLSLESTTDDMTFIGSAFPDSWVDLGERITTAVKHLTFSNPRYPKIPVIEYQTYDILSNDAVILSSKIIDPTTYAILADNGSYSCSLLHGGHVFIYGSGKVK